MIRLFVGLGNPGPEYEDTRHNAGFWWIDQLARRLGGSLQLDKSYYGMVARINNAPGAAGPIWLLQPLTYMNLSGKSVAALARFFKITPEEILAIHDELDLPPGEMKMKQGGGTGGHNGLKDMQAQLGSGNFWRLRLGIGHPGHKGEVAAYVLRKPPVDERIGVEQCIAKSLDAVELMLKGDMAKALTQIHAKPPRPKPPRPAPAEGASAGSPPAVLPGTAVPSAEAPSASAPAAALASAAQGSSLGTSQAASQAASRAPSQDASRSTPSPASRDASQASSPAPAAVAGRTAPPSTRSSAKPAGTLASALSTALSSALGRNKT